MYTRPDGQARHDERRIPTITFRSATQDIDATLPDLPPKRQRLMRPLVVGALAFALLVGGYAATRMAQTRTSTLEIGNLGDPGALVRIDGVLRGNPPLSIAGLEPGLHQIEIEAKGYEPVRMSVHVEPGQVRPLTPLLQRLDPRPKVAKFGGQPPVVQQPKSAPTTSALPVTDPVPVEPAPAPSPERPRVLPRNKVVKPAEPPPPEVSGEPVVETADVGETDIAEVVNQETLAKNQGELLISTLPWSRVFVDGIDTGRDTPVRALPVPAGAHRIGLRTPDGLMHDVYVYVEAGRVVRIIRRF
jgi:hypothetical protein